ncbi:MAG: hypothetical protein K2I62_07795, partial [Alistipes sp.]|nr:hypothetical protein [Alistipes sp.]
VVVLENMLEMLDFAHRDEFLVGGAPEAALHEPPQRILSDCKYSDKSAERSRPAARSVIMVANPVIRIAARRGKEVILLR